ncbi:MAG: substrate-binding domain-containing protein [Myxococcaceae bacterium]
MDSLRCWVLGLAAVLAAGCWAKPLPEVEVDLDAGASLTARASRAGPQKLRFSVAAMQSPKGTYQAYSRLFDRMGEKLGMDIELVQRRTYREVNDLLIAGHTDVAFVCTGGYLDLRRRAPGAVDLVAVPVVGGETTYRSLIIVPAASGAKRFKELSGKRFAFTDELSFSGHAYPHYLVRAAGMNPERFFSAALFTHSHDRSIKAVARGLVDAAAVDNHIHDELLDQEPSLANELRTIAMSPPFGIPPVVALTSLPLETRERVRTVLLGLDSDPGAAAILRELRIERFVVPSTDLYDAAAVVTEGGG